MWVGCLYAAGKSEAWASYTMIKTVVSQLRYSPIFSPKLFNSLPWALARPRLEKHVLLPRSSCQIEHSMKLQIKHLIRSC